MIEIILAIFASTGFWSLVQTAYQKKHEKDSATSRMVKGLGFDRLMHLGSRYIEQGYITREEYYNLKNYLYEPYKALGGDGVVERIMKEVEKLEITNGHK